MERKTVLKLKTDPVNFKFTLLHFCTIPIYHNSHT